MEFYYYYFCCSIILRESIITKVCTLRVLFTAPTFNSKSIAFVDEKFILYSYYLFRQNLRLCPKFLKLTASLTQPLSSLHLYNVYHPSLFRSDDSPFSMDRICRSFWPFLFLVGFCWWLYHWNLQPDAELRHWHWCSPPFRVYVQGNPKKMFVIQILSWYDEPLIHIQPWLSRQIKWWVWHENLSRKPSSDGIAKRIAGG